jgi:hypothetical protein
VLSTEAVPERLALLTTLFTEEAEVLEARLSG